MRSPSRKKPTSASIISRSGEAEQTSETEINRIAVNYLLLDYHEHGEQSVLARVLAALRA